MLLKNKLPFWIALNSYVEAIVRGTSPLSLPDAIANSLSYVKAFGGTEQRNLPDNYIERQFIYMMDGSYLLTDIVPTPDCKIEFDFQTLTIASGAKTYLGCRDSSGSNDGLRVAHISSGNFRIYGFGTYADSATAVQSNTRYKFVWNNKQATITTGGTTVFDNTFAAEGTNQTAVAINGWNTAGTVDANSEGMYLYSFKVWNAQGELVANYVPAVQKGTVPVVGFYDTVSGTFKTATAGTFAAGGEAVPTPQYDIPLVSNNGVLKYGFNYYSYNVTRQLSVANYPVEPDRSVSYSNGVLTCSITGSVSSNRGLYPTWDMSFTAGHKYACIAMAKGDTRINLGLATIIPSGSVTGGSSSDGFYTLTSNYVWYAKRWECNTDSSARLNIRVAGTNVGQYASFKDILVIDLTAIFGAGNEPTTSSDIIQRTVEIYTDGTVETINVHTRNLFSGIVEQGGLGDGTGSETKSSARIRTTAVPVKPNTTYNLSWVTNSELAVVIRNAHFYNASNTWLGRLNAATFTTPPDTAFVRFVWQHSDSTSDVTPSDISNVQLELGLTPTAYVPYFDGGTATAEMLLKVGDYQDVQSIIDGVVTRNIGVKVLDGTETWFVVTGYSNLYGLAVADGVFESNKLPMSTHYQGTTANNASMSNNTVKATTATVLAPNKVSIYVKDNANDTLENFKQFLADQYAAGTPVTVIYPLAQAVTEQVAPQVLNVQTGNNILEITQASLSNLELEASYKKGA